MKKENIITIKIDTLLKEKEYHIDTDNYRLVIDGVYIGVVTMLEDKLLIVSVTHDVQLIHPNDWDAFKEGGKS